ncbi:sulfatase family protein [Pontiella agarivorans]|uniref:Sulfatase-like hydrolase/transferase n=1 Tax=Pontiella agarivorans TaxID=3038953 RepID=A0ABU5MUA5_9BACT|nr:sulfatase-like hydrolase/transferase [Pontiella agarivorans]MDZ8117814.1 sulfatase-like hydrolase/transferase [Pontiella agarivorans]
MVKYITAVVLSLLTFSAAADERPNILIILADDLGYGDVGFTGSTEIKTPVLDTLAENGVVCENGYVTHSYCGPSRAGLLTGRHQARFGMEINATYSPYDMHMGLPPSEKTFGKRLQAAGYKTGIIGKWHVGAAPNHHPNNRGFDYFYGFLSGGHSYWPEEVTTAMPLVLENGKLNYGANEGTSLPLLRNDNIGEYNEYLTTALSRDAARFVKEAEKPFCLYLAYNAPHSPLEAPKETIEKYNHIKDRNRRIYAAMVDEMDQGIGRVVDALKESGKFENTLIFFLSDNGGVGSPPWNPSENWADNGPFLQGKASWLEGGIHVPYFVHWPKGLTKSGTFDGLVSSLDITATAVALAGGDTSGKPLDGVNLIPYLNGEKKGSPHAALYWRERNSTAWAVRTPKAKFVKNNWKNEICVFDMVNDPYESTNMIDKAPETRAELAKLWNEWNADNQANVPLHAYDYQQYRLQMYEDLYNELKAKAAKKKPLVIQ